MAAPDPAVVERQFWLQQLGWAVDNTELSLGDLKERYFASQMIKTLDINIRKESSSSPLASSITSVAGGSIAATDNGDGGVTLATTPSFKFPKFSYVEATFLKLINAAALSAVTPLGPTASGTAGTAPTAARGDHVHPLDTARPFAIKIGSGSQVTMGKPGGAIAPFAVNRALFCPIFIRQPSRQPCNFTKVSINITTLAGAGGVVRFAMWKSTANGDWDFTQKVFESGALSTTSLGLKDYAVVLNNVTEGIYWCAAVNQVANSQWTGVDHGMMMQGGNPGQMAEYFYQDGISGAFPGTPAPNVGGDGSPAFYFTFA